MVEAVGSEPDIEIAEPVTAQPFGGEDGAATGAEPLAEPQYEARCHDEYMHQYIDLFDHAEPADAGSTASGSETAPESVALPEPAAPMDAEHLAILNQWNASTLPLEPFDQVAADQVAGQPEAAEPFAPETAECEHAAVRDVAMDGEHAAHDEAAAVPPDGQPDAGPMDGHHLPDAVWADIDETKLSQYVLDFKNGSAKRINISDGMNDDEIRCIKKIRHMRRLDKSAEWHVRWLAKGVTILSHPKLIVIESADCLCASLLLLLLCSLCDYVCGFDTSSFCFLKYVFNDCRHDGSC
jgi:hypothetical protein